MKLYRVTLTKSFFDENQAKRWIKSFRDKSIESEINEVSI